MTKGLSSSSEGTAEGVSTTLGLSCKEVHERNQKGLMLEFPENSQKLFIAVDQKKINQ